MVKSRIFILRRYISVQQDSSFALSFDLRRLFQPHHWDNSPFIIFFFFSADFCPRSLCSPLKYDTYFSLPESNYECF